MDSQPQDPSPSRPRRAWLRSPLWIALGVVVTWAVLVLASDQLWRHAFGFADGDALALAVGLMAYIAIMLLAALIIAIGLRGDERHVG